MGCRSSRSVKPVSPEDEALAQQLRALRELSVSEFKVLMEAAQFWLTDSDRNGLVSLEELVQYFSVRGSVVGEEQCAQLLSKHDANGDRMLNIDEFGEMLVNASAASSAVAVFGESQTATTALSKRKMDSYLTAYYVFDKNKDSVVDFDELRHMLSLLLASRDWQSMTQGSVDALLVKCQQSVAHGLYSFPAFLAIVAAFLFSETEAVRLSMQVATPDPTRVLETVTSDGRRGARVSDSAKGNVVVINGAGDVLTLRDETNGGIDVKLSSMPRRHRHNSSGAAAAQAARQARSSSLTGERGDRGSKQENPAARSGGGGAVGARR
eukprot:Amastigsp_a340013_118.p1 type:complete len:324 gc:universal Amastigsp_a340013_118:1272-301(-)